MTNKQLQFAYECGMVLNLHPITINENGIEPDEVFKIKSIIGDYELIEICNQYNNCYKINPRGIISYKK